MVLSGQRQQRDARLLGEQDAIAIDTVFPSWDFYLLSTTMAVGIYADRSLNSQACRHVQRQLTDCSLATGVLASCFDITVRAKYAIFQSNFWHLCLQD